MSDRLIRSQLVFLRHGLARAFDSTFVQQIWIGPATPMRQALADVRAQFDTAAVNVDERSIEKALLAFRANENCASFIDLKYVCFGVSQPVGRDQRSLLGDERLFGVLLNLVRAESDEPRRFRKCYQGLMHSYFTFADYHSPSKTEALGKVKLRDFLFRYLKVALSAPRTPAWLTALASHDNLLTEHPCKRYAPAMIEGSREELFQATESIGLGANSWIWIEATYAHTSAVAEEKSDEVFRKQLPPLLKLLGGKDDLELSESLVAECLGTVLRRYASCDERPEHTRLRDLAISYIGNPWLKQAAWDAYVKDERARKMVDGWLKRRLITDFFALLSEDGTADQRRLNYWLRYEPVIEDMWFVLGSHARWANSHEFRQMRKRMEGRLHYLGDHGSPFNNAFVMKIGSYLIVEFGVTGNATYVYNEKDVDLGFSDEEISISRLKQKSVGERLIHMGNWEADFDQWLLPRLNWDPVSGAYFGKKTTSKPVAAGSNRPVERTPAQRSVRAQNASSDHLGLQEVIRAYNLSYEDKRAKGGAFWIYNTDDNLKLNERLLKLRFQYSAAKKAWWREK